MKKVCTEDQNITTAFRFFNPVRKKKIKAKPTDLTEFLKKGGTIKKMETPEYNQSINSRYKQKDIDYESMNRSRSSQRFKDRLGGK